MLVCRILAGLQFEKGADVLLKPKSQASCSWRLGQILTVFATLPESEASSSS